MPFEIRFASSVAAQLRALSSHEQKLILDEVVKQLSHEPAVETRNRKPLRPNPVAPWELRMGDLRVLYDVAAADQRVEIVLIGKKVREKLWVAGQEVKL